jgi:hypothetical protein
MSDGGTPNVLARFYFYGLGSEKRHFYGSEDSSGDYLKYVDTCSVKGKYMDYLDYSGSKEKSSGAFSRNGLLTKKEKSELRKQLRTTKSVIWDVVISFEENYGKEKMKTWRNALDVIKNEMPKLLKDNNLSYDNVVWYAGLHENTDNRHIHLSFFEKEPLHYVLDTKEKQFANGFLNKLSFEDFKVRIERRMNGHEYSLHQYRDKLIDIEETKLEKPDMTAIYDKDLKAMLLELYRKIPKGKYGYESKEMDECRPLINQITSYMMTSDDVSMSAFMELTRRLKRRDEETKEICLRSKIDPSSHLVSDAFISDLYRRCGNKILAYVRKAKGLKSEFWKGESESQRARWDEKVRRSWLFSRTLRLNDEVNNERLDAFEEFERLLEKAEYDRLVEEGVIEAK